MPWIDGKFERINGPDPQFKGDNVWQDDQQASIKVIAVRHDYHDEDLAQGISQCLNINGENAMKADLDLGGFELINLGTGEEDVADGTWTPTLPTDVTPGGNNGGSYVRIGRLCIVMASIQWITQTHAQPLDDFTIGGLPFAIATPNGGTLTQYLGSALPLKGIQLQDNTTYIFRSNMQQAGTHEVKPVQYWGENDPPNTPPGQPYDQVVGIAIGQMNQTGEFAFSFMYLTNDPMPA